MNLVGHILNKAFTHAERVVLQKDAKLIFFSDVHKGDNSYADDFAQNMRIYNHALQHYYEHNYTYIEAGDGIELWENKSFEPIYKAHKQSFDLIKKFGQKNRLYMLWGNHDMQFRDPILVERILYSFVKPKNITAKDELFDLKYHESLLLEFPEIKKSIFVLHGHQADYMNYIHWKFNRFFVRHFWKYLQRWFGINDPTSPAKNYKNLIRVEKKLNEWILKNNNQMIICGHTHRPRFPDPGELPHFNDGSCVHPDCIIGLEIVDLMITLVKWQQNTNGILKNEFDKVILAGPTEISHFV